jgi:hypothetical protein
VIRWRDAGLCLILLSCPNLKALRVARSHCKRFETPWKCLNSHEYNPPLDFEVANWLRGPEQVRSKRCPALKVFQMGYKVRTGPVPGSSKIVWSYNVLRYPRCFF